MNLDMSLAHGLRFSLSEETMKQSYRYLSLVGLLLALTAGACTRTVYVRERAVAPRPAPKPTPTMVEVNSGVWVVEDYPQPVFYSNSYYWRYSDGTWYRSATLWEAPVRVRVGIVPTRVRRIDRPTAFVYYRAPRAVARVHVAATVD